MGTFSYIVTPNMCCPHINISFQFAAEYKDEWTVERKWNSKHELKPHFEKRPGLSRLSIWSEINVLVNSNTLKHNSPITYLQFKSN